MNTNCQWYKKYEITQMFLLIALSSSPWWIFCFSNQQSWKLKPQKDVLNVNSNHKP
jgi:hypothetical protein